MLAIIGVFLVLLILLLAIPVNLVFALEKEDGWRGRIKVYWMFGLLHMSFRPRRGRKKAGDERHRRVGRLVRSGGKHLVKRRRKLSTVLRTPGFARRLVCLLRDLFRSAKPRRARIEFIIGLDDPADMGRLWATLTPLRFLLKKRTIRKESNISIELTPDFTGARFKGYSCASVQFVPLKMTALALGFVFSAPVFRAATALIQRSGA